MSLAGIVVAALAGAAPTAADPAREDPSVPTPSPTTEADEGGVVVVGVLEGDAPFLPDALGPVVDGSFAGTAYEARVASIEASGGLLARMQWAQQAARDDVAAVYWIEPADDGGHRLYLFDPQTERIWLRELPGGEAALVLESLGNILRGQTVSLSEGGPPTGMQEAKPPKPEPELEQEHEPEPRPTPTKPKPKPKPELPPVEIAVGIHYVGGNVGSALAWDHGVGLRLDVELRPAVLLRLDAATNIPRRISSEPPIRFGRIPIALAAGYRFRRGRPFRPEVDLGVVVEATYWRAQSTETIEGVSGRSARIAIAPGAGFVWTFWGGLGAHVHVRTDMWVLNHDLVIEAEASAPQTRLRPHPVAAALHGGLHYRF